jgi:hypothetical protein
LQPRRHSGRDEAINASASLKAKKSLSQSATVVFLDYSHRTNPTTIYFPSPMPCCQKRIELPWCQSTS